MVLETGLAVAGTAAAVALINKIGDACGWLAAPHQVGRMAKAEAEAAKIRAALDIEVDDLKRRAALMAEANAIAAKIRAESDIEIAALRQRAALRSVAEEMTRQANMESIIWKALPHLTGDASPGNMGNDWVVNFFDRCRNVSDDEMQELWARLLAGEANNPGSFSRRAVNLMADLDTELARLFATYCRFVVQIGGGHTPVIILDEQRDLPAIYTENGMDYNALVELSSIGLITLGFVSSLPMTVEHPIIEMPESVTLTYGGQSARLLCPNGRITTGFAIFTPVAEQLASLCLPAEPIDGLFEFVCEHWEAMAATNATLTPGSAARSYIPEGQ